MQKNYYVFDEKNPAEQQRLGVQDGLVTKCMGGVLPVDRPLPPGARVLDIACGPGEWTIALAKQYPDAEITGIDISEHMIGYAQAQARVRHLANVDFQLMDFRNLAFEEQSFDFINARFIGVAMTKNDWPALWQRCYELLAPGGVLRWSESDIPTTSSKAYDQFYALLAQAMHKTGQSFSVDGRNIGLLPRMIPLLVTAGFTEIEERAYSLDSSYYTQLWQAGLEISIATIQLVKPLLVRTGVVQEEAYNVLFDQAVAEMQAADYVAMSLMLSVWARKP